ncbi:hypothetical protein Q7P35_012610 [Cladosporium inversicolor]
MASSSPTSLPFRTANMLPDMLASSTSRPDTQETAAYAASQPLFDVLRGAISRLDEQKTLFTSAKDTVQHIHVKIPQEHIENNGTLRDDYRDALVTAWKVTTESYVRIFEQLCELTGPDPASGRAAEDSYAGFQKLLYTAEAARTVAFEQHAANTKADSGSESESSTAPSKVTTPNKNKQTPAAVASSKRTAPSETSPSQQDVQRPAKKQRTATSEASSTPAAEKATSQPNEQPPASIAQRLKPKQIRKERKQRIQAHREQQEQQQAASAMPPPAAVQPPQPTTVIQAQYADVSAEVDARLRAKEEQKKAKKHAKKRKRDSQGSHILEAEPGAEKEAAEARRKLLAQKPAKKRSKSENGEGVRVDGENKPQAKGKRGAQDESAQVEGARRSKRKKT